MSTTRTGKPSTCQRAHTSVREIRGCRYKRHKSSFNMGICMFLASLNTDLWLLSALDYLSCHPDHQRRGVAQLLVASGNVISDELKLPISCYATLKPAVKLYQKAGYTLYEEKSADLVPEGHYGTYDTAYLVRHPAV